MELNEQNNWQNCLQLIKQHIPSEHYVTWFEPLQFVSFQEGVLKVGVPTRFFAEYFDQQYVGYFMQAVHHCFGNGNIKLQYAVAQQRAENIQPEPIIVTPKKEENKKDLNRYSFSQQPQRSALPPLDSQLNMRYTFNNFVEGGSNKLSRSVGLSIAENPGRSAFNPFFLYGPSGVGKTHLVNAIGVKIKQKDPNKRVLFVSAHVFKTQFTDSVRHNTMNDFINFYQSIEVLIIDDIQEITTSKTQMAFFHIFNHLQQNNRQIIITCDRPPVLFEGIEERMLTRFKWGMVVEMEKPDTKLRRDILITKIRRDGLEDVIPADVVQYIAQNVESSVRELEGIINSIMAYSVVDNCEIDLKLTHRVVARAVNLEKREISIEDIVSAVSQHFGVKGKDLSSKSRKQSIVIARQTAMFLVHKYTEAPYSQIGKNFGKRDHSTVLYSCNQVARRISVDKDFRKEIEELEAELK